jgi:putative alpha-1,2-mannosidase
MKVAPGKHMEAETYPDHSKKFRCIINYSVGYIVPNFLIVRP